MAKESTHYDVEGPWTPLQVAFVSAYFETNGNKSAAAELAGSKSAYPDRVGWEIANLDHVKKAIAKETPKRVSSFAEAASLELLQKLKGWLYVDRSEAFNENLIPLPTCDWPKELREILVGVSAQTTADGAVIRQPKFASLESIAHLFTRALGLSLARTDQVGNLLATPSEVARVKEVISATFDRIQVSLQSVKEEGEPVDLDDPD